MMTIIERLAPYEAAITANEVKIPSSLILIINNPPYVRLFNKCPPSV
jgi:hypothetical protein